MSSNTICVGDTVKVIGKHRFLKSHVEYTVSHVGGDYVALEGLDYGCAWHVSNFRGTKFAKGDRVDFISKSALGDVKHTDLEVDDVLNSTVKIKWPDGSTGWWSAERFKPHIPMKFKMGDRVDFIDPNVIQGHSATNLEVVGFNIDRRAVNIKWPDGMSAWWSESYLKLHEPYKVRVFHYPPTNVMYYVMLDGNVFAQAPLLKSDFTLDSLLKLDGIVEITT